MVTHTRAMNHITLVEPGTVHGRVRLTWSRLALSHHLAGDPKEPKAGNMHSFLRIFLPLVGVRSQSKTSSLPDFPCPLLLNVQGSLRTPSWLPSGHSSHAAEPGLFQDFDQILYMGLFPCFIVLFWLLTATEGGASGGSCRRARAGFGKAGPERVPPRGGSIWSRAYGGLSLSLAALKLAGLASQTLQEYIYMETCLARDATFSESLVANGEKRQALLREREQDIDRVCLGLGLDQVLD